MNRIAVGDLGEFWYGDYKEPFVQMEGAVPGYPHGTLLHADDDKVLCPYCGKVYDNLGRHAGHAHGMTARQLKREMGLQAKSALVSDRVRMDNVGKGLKRLASGPLPAIGGYNGQRERPGPWMTPEKANKSGQCYAQVLAVARSLSASGRLSANSLRAAGINPRYVVRYFGNWAGLRKLLGDRGGSRKGWTVPQLLGGLASVATEIGRTPYASDLRRYGLPTATTYRTRFGTYRDACVAAGLEPNADVTRAA